MNYFPRLTQYLWISALMAAFLWIGVAQAQQQQDFSGVLDGLQQTIESEVGNIDEALERTNNDLQQLNAEMQSTDDPDNHEIIQQDIDRALEQQQIFEEDLEHLNTALDATEQLNAELEILLSFCGDAVAVANQIPVVQREIDTIPVAIESSDFAANVGVPGIIEQLHQLLGGIDQECSQAQASGEAPKDDIAADSPSENSTVPAGLEIDTSASSGQTPITTTTTPIAIQATSATGSKSAQGVIGACDQALQDADKTLGETKSMLDQSGPCPPERVAELLQQKAELESLVARAEAEIVTLSNLMAAADANITDLQDQKDKLQKKMDKLQGKIDKLNEKIKKTDDRLSEIDNEQAEAEAKVAELQQALAGSDEVSIHEGDNPLGDTRSGAATSFDGGKTWVVASGEVGVKKLLKSIDEFRSITKELNKQSTKIRKLKKERNRLNKKKTKLEAKQQKLQDQLNQLTADHKQVCDNLDVEKANREALDQQAKTLADRIKALNDRIAAFNNVAAECGIRARSIYDDALKKVSKLPSDVRDQVEEEFEEQATDNEKTSHDDPAAAATNAGGGELAGAGEKLEDLMRGASACSEGDFREDAGDEYTTSPKTLRGVESIEITDMGGVRGVSKESLKDVNTALGALRETVEASKDIVETISEGTPFEAVTPYFDWLAEATSAITKVMQKWAREGTVAGTPEWADVTYGRLWAQDVSERKRDVKVYECQDGIWQFSHAKTEDLGLDRGQCHYEDPASQTTRISNIEQKITLPSSCTLGGCPEGFVIGAEYALKEIKNRNRVDVVGQCKI